MMNLLRNAYLVLVGVLLAGVVAATEFPRLQPAPAADDAPAAVATAIRKAVGEWTQGRYVVTEVRRTPMPDLYEVRIFNDLFYVDSKARFIFVEGELIDMRANRNLTRERLEKVLAINFDALPLDLAIKQVMGKGSRRIALFEDPNCGYCKKLRADLMQMDDVAVYTFAYPILAADSEIKSRKALCAPDKMKAWADLMLSGKVPDNPGTCATPIDRIRTLGKELGVTATPTIFFDSGRRVQGYLPPEQFAKALAESVAVKR